MPVMWIQRAFSEILQGAMKGRENDKNGSRGTSKNKGQYIGERIEKIITTYNNIS